MYLAGACLFFHQLPCIVAPIPKTEHCECVLMLRSLLLIGNDTMCTVRCGAPPVPHQYGYSSSIPQLSICGETTDRAANCVVSSGRLRENPN